MRRVTVAERLSLALYVVALLATLAAMLFGFAQEGFAGDPIPTMRNIYGAPYAVITVYEVKPGMEPQFLDAMVTQGPYNKLLSGFANERILQPLPAAESDNTTYSSIGRYYDLATANFIEKQRDTIIRPFLARDPMRFEAKLVEHWLGNWGWERGTKGGATRVEPFKNDEIFQKHLSSLSYFKAGYIGQVGALELFPKGTDIDLIRSEIQNNPGLSGASIYAIGGDGRYACYREFFKSPDRTEHHSSRLPTHGESVVGKQAGVVVENYVSR
jgi:hypothetical protein